MIDLEKLTKEQRWLRARAIAGNARYSRGLGRKNPVLLAAAEAVGCSVHQMQSFAMGRRKFSDEKLEMLYDHMGWKRRG